MTPFSQYAIGFGIAKDGIELMQDASKQGAFIRGHTVAEINAKIADLEFLKADLEQVREGLRANAI